MAFSDFDTRSELDHIRRQARQSAHVQRAQVMLLAAALATMGIVAVAGALLTNLL